MAWVRRNVRHSGDNVISLAGYESASYQVIVTLRVAYIPPDIANYRNYEYNPDKGVYGRLTEMFRVREYEDIEPLGLSGEPLFVRERKLIDAVDTLIYRSSIPEIRFSRLIAESTYRILSEIIDEEILEFADDEEGLAETLFWIRNNRPLLPSDERLLESYRVAGHGNRVWALNSRHPDILWEWSILAFLDDYATATEDPGEDPPGDPGPTDPPVDEPPSIPPVDFPLDEPPVGFPPGWFDQPNDEPPIDTEFPVGEPGKFYRVVARMTCLCGGRIQGTTYPPGTYRYALSGTFGRVPGPITGWTPEPPLDLGGGNLNFTFSLRAGGSNFSAGMVTVVEEPSDFTAGELALANIRNLDVVIESVEEVP